MAAVNPLNDLDDFIDDEATYATSDGVICCHAFVHLAGANTSVKKDSQLRVNCLNWVKH